MASSNGGHWYTREGIPMHFVTKADGKGQRNTTLADARKLGLLPGVSGILKVLDKPALLQWKIKQAVMAVMTAPRLPGEADDAFVERVLETEGQHEQEAAKARDKGTEIHDAIEAALKGQPVPEGLKDWITPALEEITKQTAPYENRSTEVVVVGNGYAGRADLIAQGGLSAMIVDYKTTKKLPTKESWDEHKLQLAAYAAAFSPKSGIPFPNVRTANLYISTVEPGKFAWFENKDVPSTFSVFQCLQSVWCWLNKYDPR